MYDICRAESDPIRINVRSKNRRFFISFEYTNYRGLFSGRKNGVYFELSQYKDWLHINTTNKDILLRICAAVAQIIEEETAKSVSNI